MTYEIYRYIFIGGSILAIVMFVVSIFVFFALKIPYVIGDLTGANARKAIENIRNNVKEDELNKNTIKHSRSELTEKITNSGKTQKNSVYSFDNSISTEKIDVSQKGKEISEETTLLSKKDNNYQATTILSMPSNEIETTVLNSNICNETFVVEYDITYVHTEEVIK